MGRKKRGRERKKKEESLDVLESTSLAKKDKKALVSMLAQVGVGHTPTAYDPSLPAKA